ncbi:TPA: transposase [Staphylococcus aureus]|nr:transposase [Staphylococcus aureus]
MESEKKDEKDFELVLAAFNKRGYSKGSRSIHMILLQQGIVMNRKKIVRLMRKFNLVCPIRKANPYKKSHEVFR